MPLEMAYASDPMNTELLLAAVRQDGMALRFVNDKTLEICQAAVKQNREAIQFVPLNYEFKSYSLIAIWQIIN